MGAAIELDASELKKLAQKMNGFMLSGGDTSELLGSLATEAQAQTEERIEHTKLNPDGKKWDPWKASTLRYLQKHDLLKTTTLLNRGSAGGLLNSMTSQAQGSDTVIVGSPTQYAGYLQEGTRKMVARKFLGIGTTDIAALQDIVIRFMARHVA